MIAKQVKDLLPSEWPVTVGDLPSSNQEAVGLIEFDGYFNSMYFGMRYGTAILQPLIKVVARSKTYQQGEFWMDETKRLLNRYHSEEGDIISITMVGTPTYLGRTEQKLYEFQVTFQVQVKE